MIKNYIEAFITGIVELIKYEYKYLMCLFLILMICFIPVNYYIIVGGGISDISSRVEVVNGYKSKGSLNISYVSELSGSAATYALSYILPGAKRVSIEDYKYTDTESEEDINFRNTFDLEQANSIATVVAYEKANKDITITGEHTYVIAVSPSTKDCTLKVGDEVLEINGTKIDNKKYSDYLNSLDLSAGDKVKFKIIRNGKEQEVETPLYNLDGRLVVGILMDYIKDFKTNPKVNIKFNDRESGPSGGLMTTLSIYNQLVKKDITKGLKIAGTGTIDYDGNIGPIGEIEYKLMGAVKGGADVFIAPTGKNYKAAVKEAKKEHYKIKIIEAVNFDDVLKKIDNLK